MIKYVLYSFILNFTYIFITFSYYSLNFQQRHVICNYSRIIIIQQLQLLYAIYN